MAKFAADKMGKITVVQGDFLFAGLNSFEPGQEHASHAHEGQDKLYIILEGSGMVQVGEQTELLTAGDAAFAPVCSHNSVAFWNQPLAVWSHWLVGAALRMLQSPR